MNIIVKLFAKMKCDFAVNLLWYLWVHWKSLVITFVPVIFLPIALIDGKEAKCGFVICVMALYWVTEALPLPVTSLIPVVLLPLFGILSSEEVCMLYFKETNFMFLGGMIVAIAVEHCNLHKRIALKVMLMIGTSPQRLMLGFMITTMFLSMWITNSAATVMMTTIVTAVLDELKLTGSIPQSEITSSNSKPLDSLQHEDDINPRRPTLTESAGVITSMHDSGNFDGETRRKSVTRIDLSEKDRPSNVQISYFLGVAYAANIGGTGTLTGSSTNLVFKGIFESIFKDAEVISFATWMEFNIPLMLLNTFIGWLWLQFLFMGLFRKKTKGMKSTREQEKHVRDVMAKNYEKLGGITFHESCVLFLFVIDVLFWFFRKPEFIPGWSILFPTKVVKDSASAIAIAILLFILPATLDFLKFDKKAQKESPPLLNWKILHEKFPFGIILLLGGGFALSKACEESGLSDFVGGKLDFMRELPTLLTLSITVFAATFATEVSSNTAIANIFLPVLAKMCRVIRVHPLYLMLPATICCSYAFMLPVATPPNAIVMAASNMKSSQMMKAGIGMNLLCMVSFIFCFVFIGVPMYGLSSFPKWAEINATALLNAEG